VNSSEQVAEWLNAAVWTIEDLNIAFPGNVRFRVAQKGDRTVTPEAYAAEIAQTRQERPNLRFVVYDHSFEGDRAWFRFTPRVRHWNARQWAPLVVSFRENCF
jgi:hypothetical protein